MNLAGGLKWKTKKMRRGLEIGGLAVSRSAVGLVILAVILVAVTPGVQADAFESYLGEGVTSLSTDGDLVSDRAVTGPVTIRTRTTWSEECAAASGLCLAGFASESSLNPSALALIWANHSRGPFPLWKLELWSDSGLVSDRLDLEGLRPTLEGVSSVDDSMRIDLGAVSASKTPPWGDTVETLLAYDADSGMIAVGVTNLSTGERLAAESFKIHPYQAPLYPGVGLLRSDHRPNDALGAGVVSKDVYESFLPVGTTWSIGQRFDDDPLLALAGELHRTSTAVVEWSPVTDLPGQVRLVAESEASDSVILATGEFSDASMSVSLSSLPVGSTDLIWQYVEDGQIILSERRSFQIGRLFSDTGAVRVDEDELCIEADLEIWSDGPIDEAEVQISLLVLGAAPTGPTPVGQLLTSIRMETLVATETVDITCEPVSVTVTLPIPSLEGLGDPHALYLALVPRVTGLDTTIGCTRRPSISVSSLMTPARNSQSELNSFARYSSVLMSSRSWRREGTVINGQVIPMGTLDAMKRFMATDDKWSYSMEGLTALRSLGIALQGTINSSLADRHGGYTEGRQEMFDGSYHSSPNLQSHQPYGCMNNPLYFESVVQAAYRYIDRGITSIQYDFPFANYFKGYDRGGCFCSYCMSEFRSFLLANHSTEQLDQWGIDDAAAFDYRQFLEDKYGVQSTDQYLAIRDSLEIDRAFADFQMESTRGFHERVKQELTRYAAEPVEYSQNNHSLSVIFLDRSRVFMHDVVDYTIAEHEASGFVIDNIVTAGAFMTALGKPIVFSPISSNSSSLRQAIAACYALGQYMLVPWDIFMGTDQRPRYFGTVDDYGDLFHFVRQYPFLFDHHEAAARVGVMLRWDKMSPSDYAALKRLSMNLFEAGVPFRDIVVSYELPSYPLDPSKLEGLDYLIAFSPLSDFDSHEREIIRSSQAVVIPFENLTDEWISSMSNITVSGDQNVYATIRTNTQDSGTSAVIHLLNRGNAASASLSVTVNGLGLPNEAFSNVVLYRPLRDPERLPVIELSSGKYEIAVPGIDVWGVIRIQDDSQQHMLASYDLRAPWSGIGIGNPPAKGGIVYSDNCDFGATHGDASDGDTFTILSTGGGLDLRRTGDPGVTDQVSFAYRNAAAQTDWRVEANLVSADGERPVMGLMVRERPASNSRFVAVVWQDDGELRLAWRDYDDDPCQSISVGSVTLPVRLRLEKQGSQYRAYVCGDAATGARLLASHELLMNSELCGVFVASDAATLGSTNYVFSEQSAGAKGVFEDVSFQTADIDGLMDH